MAIERTFCMIKPDGTRRNITGEINAMIEQAGLRIVAQKRIVLTLPQVLALYPNFEQDNRYFAKSRLFMTSGPVVLQVLEGENAVRKYRDLVGADMNPWCAPEGTIRRTWARDIRENTVHGSDTYENAQREINLFFSASEIPG